MIEVFLVLAPTNTILLKTSSVIYLVQQMILCKKSEGTKNARTIHLWQAFFHILQRKCLMRLAAFFPYQNANRCRFYTMFLQMIYNVFFYHGIRELLSLTSRYPDFYFPQRYIISTKQQKFSSFSSSFSVKEVAIGNKLLSLYR